jgi:thiol:disulfide interchange protein
MMPFRLFAAGLLLFATTSLSAAPSHVKATLVAADAAVQPGKPLHVALRLVHDPHWHTYWQNPGTGLPTSLKWSLPPGFTAGPIEWPAPKVLVDRQGNVIGNGYEGDVLLPVTIAVPNDLKAGTSVELKATADWLMCEEICIPGSGPVALTLPVVAGPPSPDASWGPKIAEVLAGLPRADPGWSFTATRSGKTIALTIAAAGSGSSAAHAPKDLHFFADDLLIAYDLPQPTKATAGRYVLTLPVAAEAPKNATMLHGVLTSENGWHADGSLRGLRVDVPLTAGTAVAAPAAALGGTLALAFLGGLILNLMPCVFPVLGLKILGFVNQAGHDRAKVTLHGLVFTAGVLLSFWALAIALAVLRAGGAELGWGFQLQEPAFVYGLAALLLVFAMNMSGVFEFGLGATAVGSNLQAKSGYSGSFFTGVLATIVATPCSAPFLAPALGAALALPATQSFAVFTAIAIGLSTPYLLLSIFPQAVKVLPRPGAWMETFKQFMAFPLYATVGALAWVLTGQRPEGSLMSLFGLVLIALGMWFYGRWRAPGASAGRARFGLVAMVLCVALGGWVGWPQPDLKWEVWSPEAVAKLRAENRIVYVDFTARWCATCQTNKKIVFHSQEVLKAIADKNVALLKADWTNRDPQITAELAKYNRSAVPFNQVWLPGQEEPVLLSEFLQPGKVLDAINGKTL